MPWWPKQNASRRAILPTRTPKWARWFLHPTAIKYLRTSNRRKPKERQCCVEAMPLQLLTTVVQAGYFVQPTILEGLGPACSINQEEIFGPVITLQRFSTEAEAIKLANDSDYGLAATIWTQDTAKAHRVATQVESGIAWINCWLVRDLRTPFGGVKSSGLGREGGFEALRFFTEPQSVCIPTR